MASIWEANSAEEEALRMRRFGVLMPPELTAGHDDDRDGHGEAPRPDLEPGRASESDRTARAPRPRRRPGPAGGHRHAGGDRPSHGASDHYRRAAGPAGHRGTGPWRALAARSSARVPARRRRRPGRPGRSSHLVKPNSVGFKSLTCKFKLRVAGPSRALRIRALPAAAAASRCQAPGPAVGAGLGCQCAPPARRRP